MSVVDDSAAIKPPVFAIPVSWLLWTSVAVATVVVLSLLGIAIAFRAALGNALLQSWHWLPDADTDGSLEWLLALLLSGIITSHVIYLMTTRRKQFREALRMDDKEERTRLEQLYFGSWTLTLRYLIPAVLMIVLSIAVMAALTAPNRYLPWLYAPAPVVFIWPSGWGDQVLRGAALGFIGAYVYMLLLLTDRARQRDVTTGIAAWAAAMPVIGPIMGGVAALLILKGTGAGDSFTQDAVYFVAGMLPRQFATFIQSGVRKMFAGGASTVTRTLPLTTLRGVGPEVEARLEEEGIHDVSALAYMSPHRLMRQTTYSARQIVDWIDEALLINAVPNHWDPLEKAGVTGAIDLAWYATNKAADGTDFIAPLATEIKMPETLLRAIVIRLSQDAQVDELHTLYWDTDKSTVDRDGVHAKSEVTPQPPPEGDSLEFAFSPEIVRDARERMIPDIKSLSGIRSASMNGDRLILIVDPAQKAAIEAQLRDKPEFKGQAN